MSFIVGNEVCCLDVFVDYYVFGIFLEKEFDWIVKLMVDLFLVLIVLIGFMGEYLYYFKVCFGFDVCDVLCVVLFCIYMVKWVDLLVIFDILKELVYCGSFLVQGELGICFYVGVFIFMYEGFCIGVISIIDYVFREFLIES